MKTKEWFEQWLSVYVKGQVKPRTYTKYSQITKNHIIPHFGERELSDISRDDIQRLAYVELRQNALLSTSTINSVLMVLNAALTIAEDNNMIPNNPCRKVKRLPHDEKKVDAFTQSEQRKIEAYIEQSNKHKLRGISICLYMGLRIGELLALTWSDVDLRMKTISITKTAGDNGEWYTTKTKAGHRIIPIPNCLISDFRLLKTHSTCAYVIETKGRNTNIRAYRELFRRMLERIGIRHLCFHSLRHTFATRALECGMDIKTLSELMGHANVSITLNRYAHCQMEQKRKAINHLSKMNNGN